MSLPPVEGTRVRGRGYYLKLRIPVEVADLFPGKTHVERSLKTSDPKVARQQVILARADLLKTAEEARKRAMIGEAIAALPPDQREAFNDAGSAARLRGQYDAAPVARAFIEAGGPLTASELRGEEPTLFERKAAEMAHAGELKALAEVTSVQAKTLRALGQADIKDPEPAFGLRELVTALAEVTGVRASTVGLQNRIVNRFIEFHGDLSLASLTIAHLRDFSPAYRGLPASIMSPSMRRMKFKNLIALAKAKNLRTMSESTWRQQMQTLKGLLAAAPGQGYLTSDPWAPFVLVTPRTKFGGKAKSREPFTGEHIKQILAHCEGFPKRSIDRWGPLLAAYQGARIEEIAQLNGRDLKEEDGVWCISITDEGEGQKIKNAASMRTIPLHKAVVAAGFVEAMRGRSADDLLFVNRNGRALKRDGKGRLAPTYSKRFSLMLRGVLKITDTTLVFHSFRHSWEDAAEAVEMPATHRRDLAGRSRKGDSQAGYGDGPKLAALKVSLDKIDPLSL